MNLYITQFNILFFTILIMVYWMSHEDIPISRRGGFATQIKDKNWFFVV